ncbi:MAG: DUF3891 family protein [Thermoanaerobaculia bacterium]
MIVSSRAQGSRYVTQADHARFAADLLRMFRLPELVGHPRRETLLRAVAEHDNGWWEADSSPRLAPGGGAALDFRAFPADLRQEVWHRGVERFATESPYLAALVAAHALRLSQRWRDEPIWADFRGELAGRQEELLEAAGESASALAEDDRWMALADELSLAVCASESGVVAFPGWRLELQETPGRAVGEGPMAVVLEPFPLAGVTVFELSYRWLSAETFPSAAALGLALATAPWRRLRVRFAPF